MINKKIRLKVESGIKERKDFIIKIYSFSDELKNEIQHILGSILESVSLEDHNAVIYTCLKELISNAVRENMKRIYCTENDLSLDTLDNYKKSMKIFKEKFQDPSWVREYGKRVKENGLYAMLKIKFFQERLYFAITNNVRVTQFDEKRVREKVELSKKYTSIVDFYMDHHDDTGGAGMGLTLIYILLNESDLKNVDFKLLNKDGYLVSVIDVPLDQ